MQGPASEINDLTFETFLTSVIRTNGKNHFGNPARTLFLSLCTVHRIIIITTNFWPRGAKKTPLVLLHTVGHFIFAYFSMTNRGKGPTWSLRYVKVKKNLAQTHQSNRLPANICSLFFFKLEKSQFRSRLNFWTTKRPLISYCQPNKDHMSLLNVQVSFAFFSFCCCFFEKNSSFCNLDGWDCHLCQLGQPWTSSKHDL